MDVGVRQHQVPVPAHLQLRPATWPLHLLFLPPRMPCPLSSWPTASRDSAFSADTTHEACPLCQAKEGAPAALRAGTVPEGSLCVLCDVLVLWGEGAFPQLESRLQGCGDGLVSPLSPGLSVVSKCVTHICD